MRKECLLKDLDEVFEALQEEDFFADDILIEEDEGESAIFVSELRILIPDLQLELREGFCGMWQEDEEYYMPDFSLTAVYEENASAENYLMWEQDGPLVTLCNFTHKSMEELEELPCILLLEE